LDEVLQLNIMKLLWADKSAHLLQCPARAQAIENDYFSLANYNDSLK
jgi:hypothetical protein